MTKLAFDRQAAAHHARQLPTYREFKARAVFVARSAIRLLEWNENAFMILRGNPRPTVADRDEDRRCAAVA